MFACSFVSKGRDQDPAHRSTVNTDGQANGVTCNFNIECSFSARFNPNFLDHGEDFCNAKCRGRNQSFSTNLPD